MHNIMITPEGVHEGLLQKLCRVCGQYLSKPGQKVPKGYSCSKHQDTLLKVFNIDIDQDNKSTHPTNFCHGCHNIVYFHNKAIKGRKEYKHTRKIFSWHAHTDTACLVCAHVTAIKRGGRPKKAAKTRR